MKTAIGSETWWARIGRPDPFRAARHATTLRALRQARMPMYPERYAALALAAGLAAALVVGLLSWLALALLPNYAARPVARAAVAVGGAVFGFLLARLAFLSYPRLRASGRARRIEQGLPSAVFLCYALARGGTPTLDLFRAVRDERETYGEVSVEFGVVVRCVERLGMDLRSALHHTADTTPSGTLRGFLEGFVSVLGSGADPQDYLRSQAQAALQHGEMELEKDLEQASMLAEIYVSGLLVLPLMLIVVLSGLAPLGGGGDAFIPLIAFAFIPAGTLLYLFLVSTLMPPDSLLVPKVEATALSDFGVDSLPSEPVQLALHEADGPRDAHERRLRFLVAIERLRRRIGVASRRFGSRLLAKPLDALEFSGVVALLVAAAGGAFLWTRGTRGEDLILALTGLAVLAGLLAVAPVSVFHEMRVRRARRVEKALPDALSKLAGFNERGIGLLQAFSILGHSSTGPLAKELRAVERDVTWNGNLSAALRRFRARVATATVARLGILLERASRATGQLKEVISIAAMDATKQEALRARKRQSMVSYVVVIYIVFAVFLYVVYMVADLFYGAGGFSSAAATATGAGALARGLEPEAAKLLFMQASIIQGVCCGLVAGRLGEGHVLSGLKHAAILGLVAWATFSTGVMG